MKKILAILLALTLVFTLVACANEKDTESDVKTKETQSDVENIETSNTHSDESISSEKNSSDIETQSSTLSTSSETIKNEESSKPTVSSNPTHSHKYSSATCTEAKKCSCGETEGKALGHKWDEATCKAPKTCSICKKTEGSKVDHIVSGTTCKWCKQAVPISPTLLKNRKYTFYKLIDYPFKEEVLYGSIALFEATVNFAENSYSGEMCHEETLTPNYPPEHPRVYYNGKYYLGNTGDGCPIQKSVSDNHIIIELGNTNEQKKIEFELLSNDTLRIVAISNIKYDPCIYNFSVGDIFS